MSNDHGEHQDAGDLAAKDQIAAAIADAQQRVLAGIACGGTIRHDGQTDQRQVAAFHKLKKLFFAQRGLVPCDDRHFRPGVQPLHWIPSAPGIMRCDQCAQDTIDTYVRPVVSQCDLCGRKDLRNPAAGPAPTLITFTIATLIVHAVLCARCAPADVSG
jgi:hypothetical protein